jgi:pyrroloquinoline quinone biosynthesis protein B
MNCLAARQGRIPARNQSCVAIAAGPGPWFLINAPPDLGFELERYQDLQPAPHPLRNSPIAGVLLTNADLDHTLGLFSLREGDQLNIYAPDAVRHTLDACLGMTAVFDAFSGVKWHSPSTEFIPLAHESNEGAVLSYRAIVLPGNPPPFAKNAPHGSTHSVAYQFLDGHTGGRLLVGPDVGRISKDLLEAMANSEAVLFDGTFWSTEELAQVKPNAPRADDMGHVTIKDGSLEVLAGLAARHKVYIHINNTNPVLLPGSPERGAVEAAGIAVGSDGMEFEL